MVVQQIKINPHSHILNKRILAHNISNDTVNTITMIALFGKHPVHVHDRSMIGSSGGIIYGTFNGTLCKPLHLSHVGVRIEFCIYPI